MRMVAAGRPLPIQVEAHACSKLLHELPVGTECEASICTAESSSGEE
jgi:hypothetical protein